MQVKVRPCLGKQQSMWLVLDTGASGCTVMLSRLAAQQLGLLCISRPYPEPEDGTSRTSIEQSMHSMRAPGATGVLGSMRPPRKAFAVRGLAQNGPVMYATSVESLAFGSEELLRPQVHYTHDAESFRLSMYSSGLACNGLFRQYRFLLDMPGRRIAFWSGCEADQPGEVYACVRG
jgi:hypothetical protein